MENFPRDSKSCVILENEQFQITAIKQKLQGRNMSDKSFLRYQKQKLFINESQLNK